MINIQTIQNVSDCVPLYLPHSLYLKPLARMHISVALPHNKTGKNISNLDIMEKLSAALKPDKFLVLKVSKSTVDFIRFEAELDERARLRSAIARLDGTSLKINGFSESFRVRCSEPKDEFPTRYDWDTFFRDASHMDEMKAGERPDTIHLTHLPIRWFCPRHSENDDNVKPSESIFKRIFEKFGCVRCVDIPICDPYRNKMNSDINGMKTFSYEQDVLFEAYVQFDEYVGFVRAMDEFRGMKLVRKFIDKTQAINIVCNFDKTKHLSDAQIQRRERVRNRLIQKAKQEDEEKELLKKRQLEELELQRKKEEQNKLAELEKQRQREERRKEKHLKKIQERGQVEISQKIRVEERKLMIAQRKLESIRILEHLFDRIKTKHDEKCGKNKETDVENVMRERLVAKYKIATEQLLNEQKKKVQQIKTKTPIMGLLKGDSKGSDSSSDDDDESAAKKSQHTLITAPTTPAPGLLPTPVGVPMNPFKAAAAFAAAGSAGVNAAAVAAGNGADGNAAYSNEWMKSLSMFPYVSQVFPGMPPMYRPPGFPVSINYRGFAPRMMRPRGRGRGRGRGNGFTHYDPQAGGNSYYNNYKNYKYDDDDEEGDDEYADEKNGRGSGGSSFARGSYYRKSHYSSRNRNRSRSRSRSHSHSRSRYRSSRHYSKRSRSRSRRSSSHSSRSRSKSPTSHRTNRKLASTRRSRSPSDSSDRSRSSSRHSRHSRSRSRSRTPRSRARTRTRSRSRSRSRSRTHTRSKRSWSRRDGGSGAAEHSSSRRRSTSTRRVVLETDKLVRSAEEIKRTIEKDMKQRQRDEEIQQHHGMRKKHSPIVATTSTNGVESPPRTTRSTKEKEDSAEENDGHAAVADSSMSTADEYVGRHKKDKKRSTSRIRSRRNSSDCEAAAY